MTEIEQGSADLSLSDGRALTVQWAGVTDVGLRRESNQDAFLARFPLFVVADGMGGHAGGEIASQAAVAELRALVDSAEVSAGTIEQAIERATAQIIEHPDATDDGTGTTLTGVFLANSGDQPRWMTLNIGDSRVYLVRDAGIAQITRDHSVVQDMVDSGRLRPDEVEGHPYSNVITRAVGASEVTTPDYVSLDVHDGDTFVICSDGLTKELTDYGIQHFVTSFPEPAQAAAGMLEAALGNGGRDNVTLIVVRVSVVGDLLSTRADTDE